MAYLNIWMGISVLFILAQVSFYAWSHRVSKRKWQLRNDLGNIGHFFAALALFCACLGAYIGMNAP